MNLLTYILVGVVAAYLGYKLAEIHNSNKQINKNVLPIVDELQLQLKAINSKLNDSLTESERIELETKKNTIIELLAKFYGYSKEQLNTLINKSN